MAAKKKPIRKKSKSKARKPVSRRKVAKKKTATKKKVAKKKVARKKASKKKVAKKKATKKKVAKKKAAKKKSNKKKVSKKKASKKKTSRKKASQKKPAKKKVVKKPAKKKASQKKRISKKTVTTSTVKKSAAKKTNKKAPRKATAPKAATKRIKTSAVSDIDPLAVSGSDALIHGIAPYKPRKGEDYMSDDQLEHFRNILQAWKRELMQEVDRTVHHMQDEASNFPDPNDRATQESEFGLELRTRDRERKLLKKISSAIARVDDASYGYCEETGEEIGLQRLEARPVATLSVEAQERRELAERQFSDREDQYR